MRLRELFVAEPWPIIPPTVPVIAQEETEEQLNLLKEEFARLLLKEPSEPFKIALILYPNNTGQALRVANEWPNDPLVKQIQKQLIEEEGEMAFVATKADQAQLAWKFANNELWMPQDRIKALELCGKFTGAIERPSLIQQNNNTQVNNNVMIVTDHGDDENWERKTMEQQKRLKMEALADIAEDNDS